MDQAIKVEPAFQLKGSLFTLSVLQLMSNDLAKLDRELTEKIRLAPKFFHYAPVVVDVSKCAQTPPDFETMKTVLQNGRGYFASRISVSIFTDANVVILGILSSPSQVALYAVCDQLYKAGKNATMPVSQALYPYMTNSKDWTLFYRLLKNITIVLFVGLAFAFAGIEYILGLIFGPSFVAAIPAMQVLLVAILINFISVLFGYPAFGALGRPDYANKTVIFGAIWHVTSLALLFLVFRIDAFVAASITLSTEFMIMIIRIIKLKNIKRAMLETTS